MSNNIPRLNNRPGVKSVEGIIEMCNTRSSLSIHNVVKTKEDRRSPSPLPPPVERALFRAGIVLDPVKTSTPNRKNIPGPGGMEEDFELFNLSPANDKENKDYLNTHTKKTKKSSVSSNEDSRSLSYKRSNIFQFPSPSKAIPIPIRIEPPPEDDDVFSSSFIVGVPTPDSGNLVLTPSTANTPFNIPNMSVSPDLALGVSLSTPNRLRLEAEGLGRDNLILGRGAFGTVVLGRWRGCKVAIKVMEAEAGGTSVRRRKSLESELQARKLNHENVVRVFAVHAVDKQHAVVIMEYVGSRNLHRLLIERKEKVLSRVWLLEAASQVSGALLHCHQRKIIHLDVKPANVLVNSSAICKLGDFGCSVASDSSAIKLDHSLVGTPGYQAPEFLRGAEPSPACDVYSLSILLWQLDSREIPYPSEHPQTVMFRVVAAGARPMLPLAELGSVSLPAFTQLYTQCWAAQPKERPTMRNVVARLSAMGTKSTLAIPKGRLRV